jgi:sulfite exporter TauE/SafE
MKANVGNVDRWIRIILGVVIIVLGIVYRNWWGLIGIIPILTGIFRICPAYIPFGIKTCKSVPESK